MNSKVQEELIKSANLIREKYRALKRGKFIDEELRLENLKPLTEPLEKLVKKETEPKTAVVGLPQIHQYSTTPRTVSTPSRIPALQSRPTPMILEFGKLATKYLSNYLQPNDNKITDTTFGLRKDKDSENFSIGDSEAEITNDDITVKGKTYKGTDGLWSLLTLKEPDTDLITETDTANYKEILEKTNAYKQGYKPDAKISSSNGRKYLNFIKPMFGKSGKGLKVVTENAIDYVYWNDPNELVNRLRLLIMSREAGNSGLDNELESIIEELREANIIY